MLSRILVLVMISSLQVWIPPERGISNFTATVSSNGDIVVEWDQTADQRVQIYAYNISPYTYKEFITFAQKGHNTLTVERYDYYVLNEFTVSGEYIGESRATIVYEYTNYIPIVER